APMGWGLPAAVGACIGSDRKTLCLTGDGGLMMNIQELATVKHHQLPIKIFVLNNGGYLTIKQTQQLGFEGRLMGVNEDTGLSFPNFSWIARAHGLHYSWVPDHSHLDQKLTMILNEDGPAFCEIMMDPDQIQAPRSVNRRNPDGTMNPTKLEDGYPFLDPEEVAEMMRL
ncbi:MAG: thiamine pyrophosphate-dependent enzyme, partial [Nitrospiria bacterium]